MKGHSEQKGVPFGSPFLSKVTFVDALLTGWKFKVEKQNLECMLLFLELRADLPVFTNLSPVQNVKVVVTFYMNRQGWVT